jgi:hypothetical protein
VGTKFGSKPSLCGVSRDQRGGWDLPGRPNGIRQSQGDMTSPSSRVSSLIPALRGIGAALARRGRICAIPINQNEKLVHSGYVEHQLPSPRGVPDSASDATRLTTRADRGNGLSLRVGGATCSPRSCRLLRLRASRSLSPLFDVIADPCDSGKPLLLRGWTAFVSINTPLCAQHRGRSVSWGHCRSPGRQKGRRSRCDFEPPTSWVRCKGTLSDPLVYFPF